MLMTSRNRHGSSLTRQRAQPASPVFTRPNEGSTVQVILGQLASVKGLSVQTAAIKLGDAPVPERKYVVDVCGVEHVAGTIKLLFGQRRIGSEDLRSLLVIHMSYHGAARFLAATGQLTPMSLDQMAEAHKMVAEDTASITTEPTQTVALAAALVLMAVAGEETTMDFYQASAFALSSMAGTSKLALDPVVRIDLRTSLLLGLVAGVREYGAHLPNLDLPGKST
jgi:hypothetical protein